VLNELKQLRLEIAELKQRLGESEDRFLKIFHAASNPMLISTIKEGRIIEINEANEKLSGFGREDLIGRTTTEAGLWLNLSGRDTLIRELRENGNVHNLEVEVKSREGQIQTLLLSADPITVNGEPCLLGISMDITERKKEVDALKRSEEKYRLLVENSLQGLAIIQNGRIAYCNSAYAAISGHTISELLSFPDTTSLIHHDDHTLVFERYKDRLTGKPVPSHYEHRIIRKDGAERWVDVNASIVEFNGSPAVQIVDMDITERKHAEQVLRDSTEYLSQIINCIGDPIFVKDRSHKFVLMNDALCAFTGMSRNKVLGRTGFKFVPRNEAALLWEQEEAVFTTGKEFMAETDITDGQGSVRAVMTRKSLLVDKHGQKQILGVLRDITEPKRLEAQLRQAQKMEAIGALAGGVAHDFNNLLSVIKGYTELILEDCGQSDPKRKDLEQVAKAAERAAALTSQLLAFSRKQILQPRNLDLNEAIAEISSMLSRLIGEGIQLTSIAGSDLGLINADPAQIQQVIMNLAVNARDAMPNGGKLTIETTNIDFDENYARFHPTAQEGPYVMMAISDTGIGMDPATQARIFEPFFTTKEKGKGTGLGLSMVYGIVKQSGGFIWVYSEQGKGTSFKIYFPRIKGEAPHISDEDKSGDDAHGLETVLIAEDEDAVRTLACRILREWGYTILEAPDGVEALRLAREYTGIIHLIITDVIMPGMSGRALVSQLKAARPEIKSLYISGYTDNAIVHHGVLDSKVAFLQKPFTVKSLTCKVRNVLDS
jgi:two-component system, cell cycle sensor histidine kinase and response regulator CckA